MGLPALGDGLSHSPDAAARRPFCGDVVAPIDEGPILRGNFSLRQGQINKNSAIFDELLKRFMMKESFRDTTRGPVSALTGSVTTVTRAEAADSSYWAGAFSTQRKDRRYYELVEDTICRDFEHRYFIIKDAGDEICAIQPYFILDQDILAGIRGNGVRTFASFIRRFWPGFMRIRTLMVGCTAGEGHLDGADELSRRSHARLLTAAITKHAHDAKASLVVLKEFPAEYRTSLDCFLQCGYTRVPSLPMVRLNIDYADFEDYMKRGISGGTRARLRRNFRICARAAPIEMSVVNDATPIVDELYPLYLQVYERSTLRFETLTKDYLCRIGQIMPDKVRFFVWRQSGKVIAFSLSMVQDDTICNEYLGLDYAVALDLHLYFYIFRDIVNWAIARGYKRCLSSSLGYDPKLHLRFQLHPLDLYVRHTSRIPNIVLKWLLPILEPTRYDKTLPRFANYAELWDNGPPEYVRAPAAKRERKR
jgi:hypothetical protein